MRRHRLHQFAAGLFVVALALVAAPGPARGAPTAGPTEWKEVFSPDGSITRVQVPKQTTAAPGAQDRALAAAADVVAIQNTGPSDQRFDVVIVGDGYTASEMGRLRQHAQAAWSQIAATAPWDKYTNAINVWLVNVVSNQSGVDNDPSPGINRDTALDMYFWCDGLERLLCINEAKAKQYAAQAPTADAILAIANTTKYGGAGYPSLATIAGGNAQSARIAIHELGHSVGGLADEYWTTGTRYTGAEPTEPNVTRDPSGAKWAQFLGRSTPDGGVIGAFQGGNYNEFGIYRPSLDSLMRHLDKPFNLVGLAAMDRAISSKISGAGGGGGCASYQNRYTGSLSAGGSAYQPNGSYFYSASPGTHQACLDGPTGANFDLYLQKWNGTSWQTVASGATTSAGETLNYTGTSGYYIYQVRSASGSGTYALGYNAP